MGRGLFFAALALFVGTFVVNLVIPRRTADLDIKKNRNAILKAKIATEAAEERIATAKAVIASRTWSGGIDEISSVALQRVDNYARAAGIVSSNFRPQRLQSEGPLPVVPFTVTLEGSFAKVFSVIRRLEEPSTKLAVTLVQITSSDEGSDSVTATVGLAAFRAPATEEMTEAPRG